jgi:phosphopantothenoylcysteine synthetase/decarboxylase
VEHAKILILLDLLEIDPVASRVLHLAYAAAKRGAQVHLVAANTQLPVIEGITTTFVETADEMDSIVKAEFPFSDALIMSAAVSDFKVRKALT